MWPVIVRGYTHPRRELDTVLVLEGGDIGLREPDRDLDRDGHAVVGEHEALQRLVPQFVVADGRDDERGRVGGGVLFAVHDDARGVGECWARLRGARLWIVVACEQVVRARCRDALQKIRDGREARVAGSLVVERATTHELELWVGGRRSRRSGGGRV